MSSEKNLLCAKHRVTFDEALGFFLTISRTLYVKNVIHIKSLQSDGECLPAPSVQQLQEEPFSPLSAGKKPQRLRATVWELYALT